MNKAEFNAWLAGALGALPEVASAGYNPEYPEDGVRLVMVNGYEVALGEVVPQEEDEEDEYYIEEDEEEEALDWLLAHPEAQNEEEEDEEEGEYEEVNEDAKLPF